MLTILFFIWLPISLGIILGCLIYLFLEEQLEKDNHPEQTMSQVLKDIDNRRSMEVEDDFDLEMAELRRRLKSK